MAKATGMPDNVVSQFSEKDLRAYLNSITDEKKKQEFVDGFLSDILCDIDRFSNEDVLAIEKLTEKYKGRISPAKMSEFNEIIVTKMRKIVTTFREKSDKPKPRFLYINP